MRSQATAVTSPDGTVVNSEYDAFGRVSRTAVADSAALQYTYYRGLLDTVLRTGNRNGSAFTQQYAMSYDEFGIMTSIWVGNRQLTSFEYDDNFLLTKQNYGNGTSISYTYDEYDRVKAVSYPDGRVITYSYTGDGAIYSILETGGDAPGVTVYGYDSLGRLLSVTQREQLGNLSSTKWFYTQEYDTNNRISYQGWQYAGSDSYSNSYVYNDNGTLQSMDTAGVHLAYSYDNLLRLNSMASGAIVASREYSYRNLTDTKTTSQVSKLRYYNFGYDFNYTYDVMGNIATYSSYDEPQMAYTYDNQGQLLTAQSASAAYSYTYDSAGNILSTVKNGVGHSYTYGDSTWADLLTAYDGEAITYDGIGNPLSYYNGTRWNFTWGNGRRLETASNGTDSISYSYTADGVRTEKVVNGVTHTYYYSGTTLLRETYGNNTLDFFYDANGIPFAMKYNGTMYYYITNLQGDVIRVVDVTADTVALYGYDPYGKVISTWGSLAEVNPLRYRGYYYDQETGFYYTSSRYYDPEICRFINADDSSMLGANGDWISYNLYAYCGNNPISRADNNGYFWNLVVGAAVGMATQYIGDVIGNIIDGKTGIDILKPTSTVGEYIAAGVTAIIPGTGLGGALVRNIVTEAITVMEDIVLKKEVDIVESIVDIGCGTVLDTVFEKASDKVADAISSQMPKNYSSYAHEARQVKPNLTQEEIYRSMQRSIRINRVVTKAESIVMDIVRTCLPY